MDAEVSEGTRAEVWLELSWREGGDDMIGELYVDLFVNNDSHVPDRRTINGGSSRSAAEEGLK